MRSNLAASLPSACTTNWLLYLEGNVTGCNDEEAYGFTPLTISLMEL